jgi:uncharacterized membrane protein
MTYLIIGIVIFGGVHLFSMLLPATRDRLRAKYGERAWKGGYALVSLIGLGLMIRGFWSSRSGPGAADLLYYPADWTQHLNMLLVLLAFIALSASHGKGYLKLWLRNPMSIGFALWSFGHLLANGKRAAVYLFGTFLVIAVLDIVLSTLRGKRPTHEPRIRSDIIAVIVGVILYLIFLFGFHPYILNLPVVE